MGLRSCVSIENQIPSVLMVGRGTKDIMKKLLLLLLLSSGAAYASPLDLIYDAPGSVWGRVDASINPWGDLTHTQANIEQGIRFQNMLWITFYGGFTWWDQLGVSKSGYWSAGVKNTTLMRHLTIGIEEEDYVISVPSQPVDQHLVVGYISYSTDWNLKKENY